MPNAIADDSGTSPAPNILLVDDQPKNLVALRAILDGPGYRLVAANSGKEALQLVLREEFALILLDVFMPEMDGFEVAHHLKKIERTRTIPIIFLTAAAIDLKHIYKAYSVGAVDYLIKPLDAHAVAAKVSVFVELFLQKQEILRQSKVLLERDRREHALRLAELRVASDKRYRALVEGIDHAIAWSAETETLRFSFMSRQAERILGYSTEQFSSQGFFIEHVHSDDSAKLIVAFSAAIESGADQVCDHRFWTADGRLIWLHTVMRVERDLDGLHPELHGLSVDITDLKKAEQTQQFLADASRALAESLESGATLAKLAEWVVPFLADWCIVDAIADGAAEPVAVRHVDGQSESRLQGLGRRSLAETPAVDGIARVVASGEPLLSSKLTSPAHLAALLGVPEAVVEGLGAVSCMIIPLRARAGIIATATLVSSVSRRIFSAADVTLAEDLCSRSALASDNGRLYEEARTAVQAREDVLMVVSHDLRNPLNVVAMGAERLQDLEASASTSEVAAVAKSIQRAAIGMDRLLGDLQDLERLRLRRLSVEPSPEDVDALLLEAVEMTMPLAKEKALECVVEAGALHGAKVLCDGHRIAQVFSNLLGNAIKFSPRESRVIVRAEPDEERVRFSVRDQGPGISAENLSHVFDRFWQAKEKGRWGLGLGLAIAKGLIEAHGERIWVESEVGRGTNFFFTLPLASAA
jgi:PAS domain S-box-containing protein